VAFTDEQDRAVALMMEERRRASETLFGGLMDFRAGPTQGQEEDRLRSAIEWMRSEFLRLLTGYLTPEQAAAWAAHISVETVAAEAAVPARETETQFVRLNTNVFTAEDPNYQRGGGQNTDVIRRGGSGAWHGNAQFLLKDDALNARNAFASNKPPYQERRLSADVSGPLVPNRLTSSLAFTQTETENVTAVHATLPDGIFALGITRPFLFRQVNGQSTYQLADSHQVRGFFRYQIEDGRDQGIGGFTLPERRSNQFQRQMTGGVFPFSAPSSRSLIEGRLQATAYTSTTVPFSEALRIDVLDAFNSGGAQNRNKTHIGNYTFGSLYTRFSERVTLKTGIDGQYRVQQSVNTNNFAGTFTFSSLDAFLSNTPLTYRVTRGDPLLDTRQLELAGFVQTDLTLTSQLTVLAGVRYEAQQNLGDYSDVAPRVAVAWAPSRATVLRGGGGLFYTRLQTGMVESQRRFDGARQFEIVIDNPTFPDPFAGGTIRTTPPSVRVTDPALVTPTSIVGMASLERTFFSNLLLTVTYDVQSDCHRFRMRNLNAPLDATSLVPRACTLDQPAETCLTPDSTRGHVLSLESTGNEIRHTIRVNARQRFGIFNASANYELQRARGDVQGGVGTLSTDSYDLRADWGRAPFPLHSVNGSVNARLPVGVFLTGATAYNSGRYYTITTGVDNNRDSSVNDRPQGVGPNTLRGPEYFNVDANLSKAFFIRRASGNTGGVNMNVFLNLTNVFNRVHYGTPSGVMSSPNFRRSTSAQDPREVEAGVRFQF
jgi:hypothetical protein